MAKQKESKSGKKKYILIAVIGLIILGLGSFGGVYLWMKSSGPQEEKPVVQVYQDLDEFMVNLDDDKRSRYLKIKISVGYDSANKDAAEFFKNNTVVLRDAAIFYLKGKEAKDFEAGNEKELKKGLKDTLNKSIAEPLVLDVYMSDIIVQ